jgi:hypothetical protein
MHTNNDAFAGSGVMSMEVASLLRGVARSIENDSALDGVDEFTHKIFDANGNSCGDLMFTKVDWAQEVRQQTANQRAIDDKLALDAIATAISNDVPWWSIYDLLDTIIDIVRQTSREISD